MVKQKDILLIESYDEAFDRYSKTEYVILSRDKYNVGTKQALACKVIYFKEAKPYLISIVVNGLRRNSKVGTLNVYTIRDEGATDESHTVLGQVSDKEFLQIAQTYLLNYNL